MENAFEWRTHKYENQHEMTKIKHRSLLQVPKMILSVYLHA